MPRRLTLLFVVVIGLFAAMLLFDLLSSAGWLAECPLHRFTGLSCAGCGGTRAVHALLCGDFAMCFRMNALLLPFLLFLALLFVRPRLAWKPAVAIGAIAVIVLFALLRNLPACAFLAPQ